MQSEVLEHIHSGHQIIVKCRRRGQECVWWLRLSTRNGKLVRKCPNCIEERTNSKESFIYDDLSS